MSTSFRYEEKGKVQSLKSKVQRLGAPGWVVRDCTVIPAYRGAAAKRTVEAQGSNGLNTA
jgi:hypothetical protein